MSTSIALALLFVSSSQATVSPTEAASLDPISLPALVELLLPERGGGQLRWSHGLEAPIAWITDGFAETSGGLTERVGLARVRVDGEVATVLERTVNELAWSVVLSTEAPAKFGPETIGITPGYPGHICFGTLYEGCEFRPEQALASPSLRSEVVCQGRVSSGNGMAVYHVRASGREGYVRYRISSGSGGVSSSIEITSQPVTCEY